MLKAALIYRHKHKNLGNSFIQVHLTNNSSNCSNFSREPRPWTFDQLMVRGMNFLLWSQPLIQTESHWLPPKSYATVVPVGMFYPAGKYYSTHDTPLDGTTDVYSTSGCIAPSNIVKASKQGGNFKVSFSFIFLCATTIMWCLQQWDFTFKFWSTTKGKGYSTFRGLLDLLDKQVREKYPALSTVFYYLWFL